MRIIRLLGNVALWIGALLGVVAGGVWIAGQLGLVQPMIVISGSMEPGIIPAICSSTATSPPTDVDVGDVVSLPSELTGKLVTHRVTASSPGERRNLADRDEGRRQRRTRPRDRTSSATVGARRPSSRSRWAARSCRS